MKKNIIVIVICILVLLGIFSSIKIINYMNEPHFTTIDMDASDSPHFEINDTVNISDFEFIVTDYEAEKNNGKMFYKLDVIFKGNSLAKLHDNYSFSMAKDDVFIPNYGNIYNDGEITIEQIEEANDDPNQIVIYYNKTHKIIATINMNQEKES